MSKACDSCQKGTVCRVRGNHLTRIKTMKNTMPCMAKTFSYNFWQSTGNVVSPSLPLLILPAVVKPTVVQIASGLY